MGEKKDVAYQYIKKKIITGELTPMTSISEDVLAKELNVSRMPVHQALLQLGNEGFVYVYPRKGTVVADITLDTVRWVYEMRRLLEPYLAASACGKIEPERLFGLRQTFEALRDQTTGNLTPDILEAAVECDNELHSMITGCSNNRILRNTLNHLLDYNQWIRIRVSHANKQYITSIDAHIRIIDALIDQDPQRAEKEMLDHLVCSENEALFYR